MKTVEELNDHWDTRTAERAPMGMSMAEYASKYDKQSPRLPISSGPVKGTGRNHQAAIRKALRGHGPLAAQQMADASGLNIHTVRVYMRTLVSAGEIVRDCDATYTYRLTDKGIAAAGLVGPNAA